MKKTTLSNQPELVKEIVDQIANTPYLVGATKELLFDVFKSASLYEVETGYKLIHQGHKADLSVFILIEGRCDVYSGGQFILSIDNPGMTIGEMAVITPNAPRSADIIAKKNSRLVNIPVNFLEENTQEAHDRSLSFLRMFSNILAEKLRVTTDRAKLYEDSVLETQEISRYNEKLTNYSEDLKKELQSKLAQIKLYSQVVECSQDAIVISNDQGEIQSGNQAFSTLFGYAKNVVNKLKIKDVFVDLQLSDLDWSGKHYEGWEGQKMALRLDHSRFPAQITISPVRSNQGQKMVFATVIRDITLQREYEENIIKANEELKQTHQELENTLRELEESNHIKDQFLSNISSQLKIPLVSLINYAELMHSESEDKTALGESKVLLLNRIIDEGKKMDQMVKNLLPLSELSKGLTTLSLKVIQIQELVRKLKSKLSRIENLIINIDPQLTTIIADEDKIIEALCDVANYINQHKKIDQPVTIDLYLNYELQYIEIRVGAGTRCDRSFHHKAKNLADGIELDMQKGELLLPMAKRVFEIHNGEMILRSQKDSNCVLLSLPIDAGNESSVRIKVAIIDENEHDRKLVSDIIKKQFHLSEVFEFNSQVSALNALNAIKPNLVVVDPFFQDSPWECDKFIEKILDGNREYHSILVISKQLANDRVRNSITTMRVADFLFKPFTVEDALFKIKSIIDTKQKFYQLSDSVHKAELSAATDGMTGLYNRKYYDDFMKDNLLKAGMNSSNLSLIMTDVDNFKIYNDTNGHQMGDEVLKKVAKILKTFVRHTDMTARYGGEEFVIVLPGTTKKMAIQVAEKLRKTIEEEVFPNENTQPLGCLTASFGVATYPENGDSPESILKAADQCLYVAKEKGRNTVIAAANTEQD